MERIKKNNHTYIGVSGMVFILNSSSAGRSLFNIQVFLTGIDIEHPTHLLGRLVHIGSSCGIGQFLSSKLALH